MMAFKAATLSALDALVAIPPEYELANALPFPGRKAGMEFTHLQYDRTPTLRRSASGLVGAVGDDHAHPPRVSRPHKHRPSLRYSRLF